MSEHNPPTKESFLDRLAAAIGRQPGDGKKSTHRQTVAIGCGLFAALLIAGFAIFGWTGHGQLDRWQAPAPELILKKDHWKLLYEDTPVACADNAVGSGCLADPENDRLWQSSESRSDPELGRKVRSRQGKTFWLGYDIPKEQLRAAYGQGANWLAIGWIGAGFRVYVDGRLRVKGHVEPLPVSVPIDWEDLRQGDHLRIALEIIYDTKAQFPISMLRGEEALSSAYQVSQVQLTQSLRWRNAACTVGSCESYHRPDFPFFLDVGTRQARLLLVGTFLCGPIYRSCRHNQICLHHPRLRSGLAYVADQLQPRSLLWPGPGSGLRPQSSWDFSGSLVPSCFDTRSGSEAGG